MTRLLEKAIAELHKLSEDEQNAIAAWLLEELEDEARWDQSFSDTQDQLGRWARRVREDIDAGRTHEKGFDEL